MVVTEPIPDRLEEIGWTGGENVRDLRSSVHYLRTTADGRIAMGLGGLQPDLARHIDPRYAYDERRSVGWPTICSGCSPSSPAPASMPAGAARST